MLIPQRKFLLLLLLCMPLNSCVVSEAPKGNSEPGNKSVITGDSKELNQRYHVAITEIAAKADETVEDGWYFGQEPRILKSFYRKISASKKADFAIAYQEWMKPFKQDLVTNFDSYVPYSKRANFAFEWWSKEEPRFNTQEMKQRVLWAHESVQDANELWWRASEQMRNVGADTSGLTLAHDEEQRMLSHFMENKNSPSTISDQIWKRNHESPKANIDK